MFGAFIKQPGRPPGYVRLRHILRRSKILHSSGRALPVRSHLRPCGRPNDLSHRYVNKKHTIAGLLSLMWYRQGLFCMAFLLIYQIFLSVLIVTVMKKLHG